MRDLAARLSHIVRPLLAAAVLALPVAACQTSGSGTSQSAQQPQTVSDSEEVAEIREFLSQAAQTVGEIRTDRGFDSGWQARFAEARGILVIPALYKGGFLLGWEFGNGALMIRDRETGAVSEPAFYKIYSASFGLQAGLQDARVVFLLMTDEAVDAVMKNAFQTGADAQFTVAEAGSGASVDLTEDVLAYSVGTGLFGGGSIEGAMISERRDWNEAFYDRQAMPSTILKNRYPSSETAALKTAVAR